jgi:hypothetical protein
MPRLDAIANEGFLEGYQIKIEGSMGGDLNIEVFKLTTNSKIRYRSILTGKADTQAILTLLKEQSEDYEFLIRERIDTILQRGKHTKRVKWYAFSNVPEKEQAGIPQVPETDYEELLKDPTLTALMNTLNETMKSSFNIRIRCKVKKTAKRLVMEVYMKDDPEQIKQSIRLKPDLMQQLIELYNKSQGNLRKFIKYLMDTAPFNHIKWANLLNLEKLVCVKREVIQEASRQLRALGEWCKETYYDPIAEDLKSEELKEVRKSIKGNNKANLQMESKSWLNVNRKFKYPKIILSTPLGRIGLEYNTEIEDIKLHEDTSKIDKIAEQYQGILAIKQLIPEYRRVKNLYNELNEKFIQEYFSDEKYTTYRPICDVIARARSMVNLECKLHDPCVILDHIVVDEEHTVESITRNRIESIAKDFETEYAKLQKVIDEQDIISYHILELADVTDAGMDTYARLLAGSAAITANDSHLVNTVHYGSLSSVTQVKIKERIKQLLYWELLRHKSNRNYYHTYYTVTISALGRTVLEILREKMLAEQVNSASDFVKRLEKVTTAQDMAQLADQVKEHGIKLSIESVKPILQFLKDNKEQYKSFEPRLAYTLKQMLTPETQTLFLLNARLASGKLKLTYKHILED